MLVIFPSGLSVASQDEPRGRTYYQETSRGDLGGQDISCWYPPWAALVGRCLANAWPRADRGGAREQTPKSDEENVFPLKKKHKDACDLTYFCFLPTKAGFSTSSCVFRLLISLELLNQSNHKSSRKRAITR